jgi:DNA topoisomerase-1
VYRTPAGLKQNLSRDQFKLYSLIWEQFLASQMADAVYQQERIDVQVGEGIFRATGQKLLFNGFTAVLKSGDKDTALPRLEKGDELETRKIEKEVHYTEPPPRFTDATLVKFLEDSGIGRPSTYAPIISTLLSRYYIVREKRQFKPTFLGNLTNDLLVKHFPDLFDINFTSRMESRLDEIADGKLEWVQLLREFYSPFIELVSSAQQRLESYKGITDEETEHVCSRCGKQMIKKLGKYGFFLACSGFPECRNTMPLPLGNCPREGCDGFVIERKTKRRRTFYGCSNYPDCDFMIWDRPIACPACGSVMVEKKNEEGDKILACLNEQCGNTEPVDRGSPELVESGHEKRG